MDDDETDTSDARHAALRRRIVDLRSTRDGSRPALRTVVLAIDGVVAATTWAAVLHLRQVPLVASLAAGATAAVVAVAVVARKRLHRARHALVPSFEVKGLLQAVVLAGAIISLVAQNAGAPLGIATPLAAGAVSLGALTAWRIGARHALVRARRRGHLLHDVLLVGDDDDAARLAAALIERPQLGYRVVGVLGDEGRARANGIHADVVGDLADLSTVLATTTATVAFVASSGLSSARLNVCVRTLADAGMEIQLSSALAGIDHRRLRAVPLGRNPVYRIENVRPKGWQIATKRALDLAVLAVLAVPAALVLAVTALAIRLDDGGPVLFRQRRIGRDGRPFAIVKLRTMSIDAEARRAALEATNVRTGPLFKAVDDPRVTRIGRVLRATSLDELPQLWNVLRGEMSLVGPRPALPGEVRHFDDELLRRHHVRPGITGLWQVEARDRPEFSAFAQRDLFYVENWSVALDLAILFRTLRSVPARGWRALGRSRSGGAEIVGHRVGSQQVVDLAGPLDLDGPVVAAGAADLGPARPLDLLPG